VGLKGRLQRHNSTQLDVKLSTRSQREQLSPISSERRDPVDSVCRSWRHLWRVLTSLPGDEILEWRIWRKVTRIMERTCLFIWHIDQSLQRPCKNGSGARKHLSGNERRWLVYHTSQCSTGNKNTTDLLRADWLYAVQLGQLHFLSLATVELRRRSVYSDPPTQLNSTRRWVELRRYKRALNTNWSGWIKTLMGIKTAEQRTIIQQYGDWYSGRWREAVTFGTARRRLGWLRLRPVPSLLYKM